MIKESCLYKMTQHVLNSQCMGKEEYFSTWCLAPRTVPFCTKFCFSKFYKAAVSLDRSLRFVFSNTLCSHDTLLEQYRRACSALYLSCALFLKLGFILTVANPPEHQTSFDSISIARLAPSVYLCVSISYQILQSKDF